MIPTDRCPPTSLLLVPPCAQQSPTSIVAATIDEFPVAKRRSLLLFLLASLLLVSLSFNAYLLAEVLANGGKLEAASCAATLASATSPHPARRTKRNAADNTHMVEYAVDEPPKLGDAERNTDQQIVVGEAERKGQEAEAEVPLFLPLYTQMSKSALQKVCQERFGPEIRKPAEEQSVHSDAITNRNPNQTTKVKTKLHRKKVYREKVCAPIHSLGAPRLMARRVHHQGSAMRRGNRWFLTEYDTGYALFQFDTGGQNDTDPLPTKKRRQTEGSDGLETGTDLPDDPLDFPSQIHTLTEPFRGTDHTVAGPETDPTFIYELASGSRIQALQLRTGRRLSKLIYAAQAPLYGGSSSNSDGADPLVDNDHNSSSMDLEADQSALWLLFRHPNLSSPSASVHPPMAHLTVLKLATGSLKELGQWELDRVRPDELINAFVACGQLYGVQIEKGQNALGSVPLRVVPLFDFRSGHYLPTGGVVPIATPGWTASGPRSISNVQYDPDTDSLSVFDRGQVYALQIHRRRHAHQ